MREPELVARCDYAFCQLDGKFVFVASNLIVEGIFTALQKRAHLNGNQFALRKESAGSFYHVSEVVIDCVVHDYQSFAEECADFGSADVECVCHPSNFLEAEVVCRPCECCA